MNIYRVFGGNVQKYREEKGLSQEELAENSKLPLSTIIDIEDYRYNATTDDVQHLVNALYVEPYKLFIEN